MWVLDSVVVVVVVIIKIIIYSDLRSWNRTRDPRCHAFRTLISKITFLFFG